MPFRIHEIVTSAPYTFPPPRLSHATGKDAEIRKEGVGWVGGGWGGGGGGRTVESKLCISRGEEGAGGVWARGPRPAPVGAARLLGVRPAALSESSPHRAGSRGAAKSTAPPFENVLPCSAMDRRGNRSLLRPGFSAPKMQVRPDKATPVFQRYPSPFQRPPEVRGGHGAITVQSRCSRRRSR